MRYAPGPEEDGTMFAIVASLVGGVIVGMALMEVLARCW